jgi:putative sterol carrier protein
MTDATADFFHSLVHDGGRQPLGNLTATIRIDLEAGEATEHWLLAVDKGHVAVSHRAVKADATMRTTKELFDRLVRGEANAMASLLRGLVSADGDTALLLPLQRLFPGPIALGSRPGAGVVTPGEDRS